MTRQRRARASILAFVSVSLPASSGCFSDHCQVYPQHCADEQADGETDSTSDSETTTETGTDTEGSVPEAPVLQLSFSQVKQFEFSWAETVGAEHYQLLESADVGEGFVPIAGDIVGQSISIRMPLHFRAGASYQLLACNEAGCAESEVVDVVGTLAEAVGYFKASNTDAGDFFGWDIALSADGDTLAVGAYKEDSDSGPESGAVHVFVRDGMNAWSPQAHVEAPNADAFDGFGYSVALSADGGTLAVGAVFEDDGSEDSGAVHVFIRDDQNVWTPQAYVESIETHSDDNFGVQVMLSADGNTMAISDYSEDAKGAVHVFVRDGLGVWSGQAHLESLEPDPNDRFGQSMALSADGNTLVVGSPNEDSGATGINGNENDDSTMNSGAVFLFVRDGQNGLERQTYFKASEPVVGNHFGYAVALSTDGNTLAVGAPNEEDNLEGSGSVYLFVRQGRSAWSQQTYLSASDTDPSDLFGYAVALGAEGSLLAVSAPGQDASSTGIADPPLTDNAASESGAVYVFVRGMNAWSQRAHVKAPNTGAGDFLGSALALSTDGHTLAAGAVGESSSATGISGTQADDSAAFAGAVYLY
jgi:hypothetical protein